MLTRRSKVGLQAQLQFRFTMRAKDTPRLCADNLKPSISNPKMCVHLNAIRLNSMISPSSFNIYPDLTDTFVHFREEVIFT